MSIATSKASLPFVGDPHLGKVAAEAKRLHREIKSKTATLKGHKAELAAKLGDGSFVVGSTKVRVSHPERTYLDKAAVLAAYPEVENDPRFWTVSMSERVDLDD